MALFCGRRRKSLPTYIGLLCFSMVTVKEFHIYIQMNILPKEFLTFCKAFIRGHRKLASILISFDRYILGVLMHTTALDRNWVVDETLKQDLMYVPQICLAE